MAAPATTKLLDTVGATPLLRWSSVRDCPRKAILEATGAPARERTDQEQRILFRGKTIGRDFADLIAATAGEHAIERERKVAWPLGIGHIDVYIRQTKTVVEVLSSAHASPDMIHSKLIQAVGYTIHDPEAENACLVILNPSDYSEERIVVMPDTPQWDTLAQEVQDRVDQVLAWRDTSEMPNRVCRKPADARGHFCLHAEHCFDGWTPEPLPLVDSEDAQLLARKIAALKQKRTELSKADKPLEEEQKQLQAELAGFVEPGEWQVGGWKIVRSARTRRSFDVAKAEQDSRFHPDLIAEFTKTSQFDVWTVEQTGDAFTPTDDEAPF
jgi:hypothetical protein